MDGAVTDVQLPAVETTTSLHDARNGRTPALGPDVDAALRQMVRERTEELETANAELRREIAVRTAQMQALNQELEAFGYSVSHDLRAPLRSMDGFSRVLLEDYGKQLDDQARDYLQRIRAASQRMAQLIEDILQLSRVSRADMNERPINLSQLANDILDQLQEREPNRQLERVTPEDMGAHGDPALVRVLMENLIGNAWKFTSKHDRARIEVGVENGDDGPVYYVRDDGAGFDMAYANKLFGAFQRLHSGSEFDGTGIGLATVQRIVRRHSGKVWAEAKVEKGATFYFTLGTPPPPNVRVSGQATEQTAPTASGVS